MALWAERVRNTHNRDMALAWQVANLTNAKKLPPLRKFQIHPPDANVQSFDEQKSMLAKLSKNFGGMIRTVKLNG